MNTTAYANKLAEERGPKFAHVTVIAANSHLFIQALQNTNMAARDAAELLMLFSEFSAAALATIAQEADFAPEDIMGAADILLAIHERQREEKRNERAH